MFHRLGNLIARHWIAIVLAWIALAIGLAMVAPKWNDVTHDGDLAYLPDRMPSVEGEALMSKAFPTNRSRSTIALIVERQGAALSAADIAWTESLAKRFELLRDELGILDIWTPRTDVVGEKLLSSASEAGQAAVVLLQLSNEFMAADNVRILGQVNQTLDAARTDDDKPAELLVGMTGSAAIGGDMLTSAAESIKNTELATVALVVTILLLVYRAPLLVLIPMISIGVAFSVAINLLALLTQLDLVPGFEWWDFKVFTTTKIFIVVVLFGSGTDFCLFLISRYREELGHGMASGQAVAESVSQVGEALVGSAMTTIFGLGMMFFADFGKFRNSGPAIALCLLVTLIACLTLAPALLRGLGKAVFWPFAVKQLAAGQAPTSKFSGFWDWAAGTIIRRPGIILVASLLLVAPLAYAGADVPITYDFLSELDDERPSVIGTDMAKRHFAAGEMSPVTILALKQNGQFDTSKGEREIARLTKILTNIDGVESVRSIAEPTGTKPGYFQPFRLKGLHKLAARKHRITKANYVTQEPDFIGDVARFDLVLRYDPFSIQAIELLNEIDGRLHQLSKTESSPWHRANFGFLGTTVGIRDLKAVTSSDQVLIQHLVVISVLAVLLVILRRPIICLYLIASVLLSYYVTIGATELVFEAIYGSTFHGLDWKVPIFLFVILIAVGEDYNIYLCTRVFEEQRRHGPIEGLRLAVSRTGGIITSCGVIMAGTFVSMMTGTLRGMLELGFALSLGVMLDTCVVRPILVPAFLALLERARWRLAVTARVPVAIPTATSRQMSPE